MTDTPFRYDESLLRDCAASTIALKATNRMNVESWSDEDVAIKKNYNNKDYQDMFSFENLLDNNDDSHTSNDESVGYKDPCRELHRQFLQHFYPTYQSFSNDSTKRASRSTTNDKSLTDEETNTKQLQQHLQHLQQILPQEQQPKSKSSYLTFIRNVVAVHRHNHRDQSLLSSSQAVVPHLYHITLNRFADVIDFQAGKQQVVDSESLGLHQRNDHERYRHKKAKRSRKLHTTFIDQQQQQQKQSYVNKGVDEKLEVGDLPFSRQLFSIQRKNIDRVSSTIKSEASLFVPPVDELLPIGKYLYLDTEEAIRNHGKLIRQQHQQPSSLLPEHSRLAERFLSLEEVRLQYFKNEEEALVELPPVGKASSTILTAKSHRKHQHRSDKNNHDDDQRESNVDNDDDNNDDTTKKNNVDGDPSSVIDSDLTNEYDEYTISTVDTIVLPYRNNDDDYLNNDYEDDNYNDDTYRNEVAQTKPFQTPIIDKSMSGTFVDLKRNKEYDKAEKIRSKTTTTNQNYFYKNRADNNDNISRFDRSDGGSVMAKFSGTYADTAGKNSKITSISTTNGSSSSSATAHEDDQKENTETLNYETQEDHYYDPFETYLNWATTENPDGVPIVHKPVDQGTCGSCWALAASGSVEASAARREAYNAFKEYRRQRTSTTDASYSTSKIKSKKSTIYNRLDKNTGYSAYISKLFKNIATRLVRQRQEQQEHHLRNADGVISNNGKFGVIQSESSSSTELNSSSLIENEERMRQQQKNKQRHKDLKDAIEYAQVVEKVAFQMLNLSIQELLDCDTAADQGCTGGNPLLSFDFIHRYGLTSWKRYPYVGEEGRCRFDAVKKPVATVKSWGILSGNHEQHMKLAIRYIGPISVGFNGADPTFLSYSSGIYNQRHCGQNANHALLIVGYGQEDSIEPKIKYNASSGGYYSVHRPVTTKYWIARNSWGTGWGENGYVRIRRSNNGKKGTSSVCGIARNPSVALGGTLLRRIGTAVVSPQQAYETNQVTPRNESTVPHAGSTPSASLFISDSSVTDDLLIRYHKNNTDGAPIDEEGDEEDSESLLRDINTDIDMPESTHSSSRNSWSDLCHDSWFIGSRSSASGSQNKIESWCYRSVSYVEANPIIVSVLMALLVNAVVVWPLTADCRKRHRRRRLLHHQRIHNHQQKVLLTLEQQQKQQDSTGESGQQNQKKLSQSCVTPDSTDHKEVSPLFGDRNDVSYGSTIESGPFTQYRRKMGRHVNNGGG